MVIFWNLVIIFIHVYFINSINKLYRFIITTVFFLLRIMKMDNDRHHTAEQQLSGVCRKKLVTVEIVRKSFSSMDNE